jgi:hypothetical protein
MIEAPQEEDHTPDDRPRYPVLLPGLAVVAWLWAFACLPFVTDAGWQLDACCILVPAGAVITLTWAAIGARLFRIGFGHRGRVRAAAAWSLTLLAVAGVVLLTQTDLDLSIRVRLSERSLLEAAEGTEPDTVSRRSDWVGLFYVHRIERSADGRAIAFETTPVFLDSSGLVYLPPGSTCPMSCQVCGHLFGNWYVGFWEF